MERERIRQLLPEEPPEGLLEWARKKHQRDELGGEYCVYYSERVPIPPDMTEVLEHNSLASRRKEWAAVCTCTCCQEDFVTQKEPGMRGIRIVAGEDGWNYVLEPGAVADPYMGIEVHREWDSFLCPVCGHEVKLLHKQKLKGGRTKQIMVISLQDVHGYMALIYWMVKRTVDEDGISSYAVIPEDAFVLTERGTLLRYSHVERYGAFYGAHCCYRKEWKLMGNNADTIDKTYPDWGSINNRKCGADIWPVFPDLEETTGEKTALIEYLKADGYRPVAYLKWWRRRRNIENLCRQGQAKLVAEIVSQSWRYSYSVDAEAAKYIDMKKRRPFEMLGMTREEFRWVKKTGTVLTIEIIERWRKYKSLNGKLSLTAFLEMAEKFRASGINAAMDMMAQYGDADIDRIARYLGKRNLKYSEAGILLDTRNAIKKLYNRPLTNEELWPKHLHETHDRAHRLLQERKCQEAAEKMREGFGKILDSYGHLQWTDGELAVIIPRDNGELVREGDVLRHCVGMYGAQHIGGSSVIFFIRHHRRPERPYYTLAIDMRNKPAERQLHGYGNERHGPNKEYAHKIPKSVRDFCNRWENEVLMTWYAEQQKQKKEQSA